MSVNQIASGGVAVNASANGQVFVLGEPDTLTNAVQQGTFNFGIYADVTLNVAGTITSTNSFDVIFGPTTSSGATVYIEQSGRVRSLGGSGDGVEMVGPDATVINEGKIYIAGADAGIQMTSGTATNGTILNYGRVESVGWQAVQLGDGTSFYNSGKVIGDAAGVNFYGSGAFAQNDGLIRGDIAVGFTTNPGDINTFINDGVVVSRDVVAISGGASDERVVNNGSIKGDVNLGSGSDVFDGRSGTLDGGLDMGTGNDRAMTGGGRQVIILGDGYDFANAGDGNDKIVGGAQNDVLAGAKGNDRLLGGTEDDILRGGQGNDRLNGGSGEDILVGGGQNDRLTGGADADVFKFGLNSGTDRITDYVDGVDKIDLSDFGLVGFAALNARISSSNGNAVIDLDALGGSGSIIVVGAAGDLSAGDFFL
jgi:Ca2+-binding RTX toxin-like protein